MTWPDFINGIVFELGLGSLVWFDVAAIRRDLCLRGRSGKVAGLFLVWSTWNLWYYPHLGQWLSFVGGVSVMISNGTWCYYAWRYRHE